MNVQAPRRVFICYSHKDNDPTASSKVRWLDRIRDHLKPFEDRGELAVFADDLIELGTDWHARIQEQLRRADVALLLVSASFLASPYVGSNELPVLLQRASETGLVIIPVLLSPSGFEEVRFRYPDPKSGPEERRLDSLLAAGTPGKTLCEMEFGQQERTLAQVANSVRAHAQDGNARRAAVAVGDAPAVPPHRDSRPRGENHKDPARSRLRTWPIFGACVLLTVCVVLVVFYRGSGWQRPLAGPREPKDAVGHFSIATKERRSYVNSLGMCFVPGPDEGVWFSIWETRVRDYATFASADSAAGTNWQTAVYQNQKVSRGPLHPVVNLSWADAAAFCAWLTRHERKLGHLPTNALYRLPTDREWSHAVGLSDADDAGASPGLRSKNGKDVFPWGTEWPPRTRVGNYCDTSAHKAIAKITAWIADYDDLHVTTAEVGSYPPNRYGLFDLGGNAWEWCQDTFETELGTRVLRGASFRDSAKAALLSSCRYEGDPKEFDSNSGFRCVIEFSADNSTPR